MDNQRAKFERDCLKVHGYLHTDSESDSGKSEFDDDYYRLKPPAIRNSNSRKVIKVGNNEQVKTTHNLDSANKRNNSSNKAVALPVNNLSTGESQQNETFKKPSAASTSSKILNYTGIVSSSKVNVNQSFKRPAYADNSHNSNVYQNVVPNHYWQNNAHRGVEPRQFVVANKNPFNTLHSNGNQYSTPSSNWQNPMRQNIAFENTEPRHVAKKMPTNVDEYHNSNGSQNIVPTSNWQRQTTYAEEHARMQPNNAHGSTRERQREASTNAEKYRRIQPNNAHGSTQARQCEASVTNTASNDKIKPDINSKNVINVGEQSNASNNQNRAHTAGHANPAYDVSGEPRNETSNYNTQDLTSDIFLNQNDKSCCCGCSIL